MSFQTAANTQSPIHRKQRRKRSTSSKQVKKPSYLVFLFVTLTSAMVVSTTTMLLILPQQDDAATSTSSRVGSASLVATLHQHMKQHHFFLQKQQQSLLEAELLARLVDLLQSRWTDYLKLQRHATRKERNTLNRALTSATTTREEENDSYSSMSPLLLESMQDYFNRYYKDENENDDAANSHNIIINNNSIKNKRTSHFRRRKPTLRCWMPQSSDSQCDSKTDMTYTILAPLDLRRRRNNYNKNNIRNATEDYYGDNEWTTQQLRQMVWYTLEFLFDTQATRVIWLVLGGDASRQAIQVDSQYGTQLLQWDHTRSNPVQLVYAETLSDAIQQVWMTLTATSSVHVQHRPLQQQAILWRNVQEHGQQQHNIEPTRAQIHHGLQIWKASTSALVAFQARKEFFAANKHDNESSALPDWNGLIHRMDYLCFLVPSIHQQQQQQDQSTSWLSPLFSNIVRDGTIISTTTSTTTTMLHEMTPWDVVLTVGHLSPVPWRLYGPQNTKGDMGSSTITSGLSEVNSIRSASKVWGGFPVGPTPAQLCPADQLTTSKDTSGMTID